MNARVVSDGIFGNVRGFGFGVLLLSFVVLSSGCDNPQEAARKELAKLGKDFNPVAFVESVVNGDKLAVKLFLTAGINVNEPAKDGETAIMAAAGKGDKEIVQILLDKGANLNAQSGDGGTALIAATVKGDLNTVQALLDKGANPNLKNKDGVTAIGIAALAGNSGIIAALLDRKADPNVALTAEKVKGVTPLIACAMGGHVEAAKVLLAKGADINAQDANGLTAADYARAQTNLDLVKLLWDHGAPVVTDTDLERFLDNFGKDLQSQAFRSMENGETPDSCRRLIAQHMSMFKDQQGFTTNQLIEARVCAFNAVCSAIQSFALSTVTSEIDAARQKAKPFMELRKELQADKQVQAGLLRSAADKGESGLVKWLLEQGAEVNARSPAGFTSLMFAARNGSAATVQILLEAGANANLKGYLGMTPVMFAVANGKVSVVKMLLAAKADVNASNDKGQTALMMAAAKNDAEAISLLKDAGATE